MAAMQIRIALCETQNISSLRLEKRQTKKGTIGAFKYHKTG